MIGYMKDYLLSFTTLRQRKQSKDESIDDGNNNLQLFTEVEVNSGGYLHSREAASQISTAFTDTNFPFVNGRCHLKRSMPFLKRLS